MSNPSVRRICGLNLKVQDLTQAVMFYTHTLGLKVRGIFSNEAFLKWKTQGEDFLGLFKSQKLGWHHVELRFMAPDVQAALRDLQAKALIDQVRSVGSSEISATVLHRWLPSGVEIFTPLTKAVLIAEVADPNGRMLELVYLKEDYTALELPGLLAVEIESPNPSAVTAFYSQVGFEYTLEGLQAASRQKLLIRKGERLEWVRARLAMSSHIYARLTRASLSTAEGVSLSDPNGYELIILPEGGITS